MSARPTFDAVLMWDPEGATVLNPDLTPRGVDLAALKGARAVVLLSRRLVQVRTAELPPASPEDLRQLVSLRLGDLFPAAPSDLAFVVAPRTADRDAAGAAPETAPGLTTVYAARQDDLKAIHAAARTNGFRIVATLPAAAGSALLCRELGLADALVAAPDGPHRNGHSSNGTGHHPVSEIGFDVVRSLATTLSRPVAPGSGLEGEARRTLMAAGASVLPIVATGDLRVDFADRSTVRQGAAALLEDPALWPALDLVPDETRARLLAESRRRRHRQAYLILAASLLVAGYVANDRANRAGEVERRQKKLNAEVKRYENVLTMETSRNTKLDPQASLFERAFTPAQRASDVVYLLASRLPPDAWLTNVTFDRGKPLQIRGTAKTSAAVIAYVRALGTERRLRDVRLSFANVGEIETKPIVNFALTAFPVGNIPLEEPKKRRASASASAASPAAGSAAAPR